MDAVGAEGILRALVLGPFLLALPGFLLLLPLTPGWGLLPRAVAGFAVGAAAVSLGIWGAHAWLGHPLDARLAWSVLGALVAVGALAALLGRRAWWPMRIARPGREHALLAGIVLLGLALLYRPRVSYDLPLHVDEWWHLLAAMAMERQGTTDFVDPRLAIGPLRQNGWIGFHLLTFAWRSLSGAGWIDLFHVGPLVLGGLLIVAAWCSGKSQGYGLEAALLVALIPTSLRVLGPQFFAPITLGLLLIPVAFLLFTSSSWRTLPLLALLAVFMVVAHPQSGAALGMLVGTYAFWSARHSLAKSAALALVAALPFALVLFLFPEQASLEKALDATPSRLSVPEFLLLFGLTPAALFLAGTYLTLMRPSAERLAWVTTSFLHLLMVALFLVAQVGQANLYDRAWMHAILTMSITGGYALMRIRVAASGWRLPRPARASVLAVGIALVVVLASTAQARREDQYYHVISEEEYHDFLWIRDHVEANGSRALLDPWKGMPFATLAGMPVYAYFPDAHGHVNASRGVYQNYFRAVKLLEDGAKDEAFLQRANVTLVYTTGVVENQNFTQVHPRVWVRTNVTVR